MYTADYFIEKLGMESHIEGGYYKETYRSSLNMPCFDYSCNFEGNRSLSTLIYFLLKSGQVSKLHRLKADEIWIYHYGCPMLIHMIDEKGIYSVYKLGLNIEIGELPQVLVPANVVFGAEPQDKDSFSFVSCMVSPGFDFRDFVMYEEAELIMKFPKHKEIIRRLNR